MFDDFLAKEKVDVLFHYQDSHFISSPLINICRKNNIPYVGELNELLPAQGYKGMYLSPWFWDRQYYLCHTLKRISGVVAISSFLENYLQKRQIPVIRVPALGMDKADCLPAKPNCKNRNDIFTVVYTGLLAPRDIPLTLLESVRRAVRLGVPMKLLIIGIADHLKSGRVAKKIVADDSLLSSHVKFTGWVSDSELKLQMAEANAMVLVREDSKQTRACFPTRLPQYFLAGKPVILSAVGDMPLYFTHKQNAWLVPGGNHPQEIAEAFHYLWQHPAEADAIGQHGRETALTQFSCKLHGKRLYDFFTTLSEKARR
jgi:glycosyltransferase involved in cell wall biosynthesis